MSLSISSNVAALNVQHNITRANDKMAGLQRQLASGDRIVNAGDDEAGYATSEALRHEVAALKKAQENTQGATGMIQVAEGALNEQGNILLRLRELAVQASSDTVSEDERSYLDTEFQQLLSEADRIAQSTRYGQRKLLVGASDEYHFQVGTGSDPSLNAVKFKTTADTRNSHLGISGLSITDRDDALDALESLDEGANKILQARANFGSLQSRLGFVSTGLEEQTVAASAARSKIADVDIAEVSSELAVSQVQQQAAIAVLAQANTIPARALRLLG